MEGPPVVLTIDQRRSVINEIVTAETVCQGDADAPLGAVALQHLPLERDGRAVSVKVQQGEEPPGKFYPVPQCSS